MCGPLPGGGGPLLLIITSDAISGTFLCLRERKSKLVHKDYPAFDQLSGPEVSGHLAKNRYVCFYALLDGC